MGVILLIKMKAKAEITLFDDGDFKIENNARFKKVINHIKEEHRKIFWKNHIKQKEKKQNVRKM
jgi:hypothetical protein